MYDETDDSQTIKVWEWPRTNPAAHFFRGNGFCEDGQAAINTSIPQGEYYIAFGSASCATMSVNLTTGLLTGCGKVELVPCASGTDCEDCGRSASFLSTQRRRLDLSVALPDINDAYQLSHMQWIIDFSTSYSLPRHYIDRLATMG